MNINKTINKYLNEKENFQGKEVVVTTKTGAVYSGIYHKSSDKVFILSKLAIINKEGGVTKSKNNEKRKFDMSKVEKIELK